MYGIDKVGFSTWFKNRRQAHKKPNTYAATGTASPTAAGNSASKKASIRSLRDQPFVRNLRDRQPSPAAGDPPSGAIAPPLRPQGPCNQDALKRRDIVTRMP